MSTGQQILTIAIPTYNRSRFLKQLLTALAPQLRQQPRVELIVSDNASTDDTSDVLALFQQEGLQLIASRNEVNIGADGNIRRCFELASSKYVWIIGDDDIVNPDAVSRVLSHLDTREYDILYLRSVSYDTTYTPDTATRHQEPETFTDALEFVRKVNVWFTFITGNVINKERALLLSERPSSDFLGTSLVQLSWTFPLLTSFRAGLFVYEPLVAAKADNTGNYSACRVFGANLKSLSESLLPDRRLSNTIVNSSIKHMLPRILLTLRFKDHAFHAEDPEQTLRPAIGNNFRYWIFCHPLIRLPKALAWSWYYGLRVYIRIERLFSR